MAKFVIKKNGSKEAFDAEKIKHGVSMAAAQAGLSLEEAVNLAEKVAGLVIGQITEADEVQGEEIKAKILSVLDQTAPKVAKAWRDYEAKK